MTLPYKQVPVGDSCEIRSLNGRVRVPFTWLAPHTVDGEIPVTLVYPARGRFPVGRVQSVRAHGFTVNAQTRGADTGLLRGLLEDAAGNAQPVGLVHADCHLPGCDIPQFQTVWVTSMPSQRAEHTDVQHTVWTLAVVPANEATIGEIPVWTWADVAKQGTWADVAARFPTWADVAKGR